MRTTRNNHRILSGVLFAATALVCASENVRAETPPERGKYLSVVAGCNDCHTAGFAATAGKIPEADWLKGDPIGWKGPWGTTYAINLRKLASGLKLDGWLQLCRSSQARPPMPAYALHNMTTEDLTGIYEFLRKLGDGGELMPAALPPGAQPAGPYLDLTPQNLPPDK